MLNVGIITLFPNLFHEHITNFPISKAVGSGELSIKLIDLRNYGSGNRKTVDEKLYGGGVGMLLKPEPIYKALIENFPLVLEGEGQPNSRLVWSNGSSETNVIAFLTPKGKQFTHKIARNFSTIKNLVLICGRYEGVDQRIIDVSGGLELSVGPYVLSGGEVAAMAVIESTVRFLPNVLEEEATDKDSFEQGLLEHPQYTRPADFIGRKVPETLLTGHHKNIERWRAGQSQKADSTKSGFTEEEASS